MKNFSLLYQYEIKKLLKLKIFPVGFSIILAVVLAMNLLTLINYSIGHNGAAAYKLSDKMELEKDYSRMLTGIDLYYVDEKGDLITEKVGPFKYIRKQKEFAQKWSGKPLDDETITAMQNCIDKYNFIDEETEYNNVSILHVCTHGTFPVFDIRNGWLPYADTAIEWHDMDQTTDNSWPSSHASMRNWNPSCLYGGCSYRIIV